MYICKDYGFISEDSAKNALDQLKRIAKTYGFATVADYYDICELHSSYTDNKVGWTYDTLNNITISCNNRYSYEINLPSPIPLDTEYKPKSTYREYSHKYYNKKSTPEPLCITIHTNELDDVDATLAETFKYIYTIKDRMVNLTIM